MKKQDLLNSIKCMGLLCKDCFFDRDKKRCKSAKIVYNFVKDSGINISIQEFDYILYKGVQAETRGQFFTSNEANQKLINRILFDYQYPVITKDNIGDIKKNDTLLCTKTLNLGARTTFNKDRKYKVLHENTFYDPTLIVKGNSEQRFGLTLKRSLKHFRTIRKH